MLLPIPTDGPFPGFLHIRGAPLYAEKSSPTAAHVADHIGQAQLHAHIAPVHGGITVSRLTLAIPTPAVLQYLLQFSVITVSRFQGNCPTGMFQRRHIVAQAGVGYGTVIEPTGIPLPTVHLVQRGTGLPVIAVADIVACRPQMKLLLLTGASSLAITAIKSAKGAESKASEAEGVLLPLA